MKVGFIGLGAMGRHMARNLQESGNNMTVHDLRREAATDILESGAEWADTPKEVALKSDVIFTSLPGPTDVENVVLGPDGITEGITTGQIYLDLSTNSPTVARRLHPPTDPEPRWLPTRKAATYLGVSPATLRRYASESDIIERREGAGRAPDQYLVSSLDAYREAQRRDYSAAA